MPRNPKDLLRKPRRLRPFGQPPFFYWAMFTRIAGWSWQSMLSTLGGRAAFIVTGMLLLRLLKKEAYGDYQTILSLVKWPMIVALFPVHVVLPRYLAHHYDDPDARREWYGAGLLLKSSAIALALAVLGGVYVLLAKQYQVDEFPVTALLLAFGMLVFSMSGRFFLCVLQGYSQTKRWSFINVVGLSCVCATMIAGALAYHVFGMIAVGTAGLLAWVTMFSLSAWAARRTQGYLLTFRSSWSKMKELAWAATPMLVSTAAVFGSHAFIAWRLVTVLDKPGKVEVGYFALTHGNFFSIVTIGFNGLMIPLLPLWSRKFRNRRYRGLVRAFDATLVLTTLAGAAIGAGFYFGADSLVELLYGPGNEGLADCLKVMARWCPLYMIGASVHLLGIAIGRTGKIMWANISLAIVSSVLTWWLAAEGAAGACEAMVAGHVVFTVVYLALGLRDVHWLLHARGNERAWEAEREEA